MLPAGRVRFVDIFLARDPQRGKTERKEKGKRNKRREKRMRAVDVSGGRALGGGRGRDGTGHVLATINV
jgi:hypothetical protein